MIYLKRVLSISKFIDAEKVEPELDPKQHSYRSLRCESISKQLLSSNIKEESRDLT